MKTRIMYIENKSGENDLIGEARIGRVTFSKTGKSIHYKIMTCDSTDQMFEAFPQISS